ncbi:MAG: hypothetical protein U0797_22905 [Gemmataceae bacterium]
MGGVVDEAAVEEAGKPLTRPARSPGVQAACIPAAQSIVGSSSSRVEGEGVRPGRSAVSRVGAGSGFGGGSAARQAFQNGV